MSEKFKEDLVKTLTYYYDIKLSAKYLIYFKKQKITNSQIQSQTQALSLGNELVSMIITDGIDCWSLCINDEQFLSNIIKVQLNENVSYVEFLSHLINNLRDEKFELNQILSNSNEKGHKEYNNDLLEFKFTLNNNSTNKSQNDFKCILLLEPILSAKVKADEIKNCLFFAYQKFAKTDLEVKKMKNNLNNGRNETNNSESSSNGENSSLTRSKSNDMIKARFGLKVNSGSGNLPRKPGMSIINPFSKRRKAPGGITFDDEDDNDEDESQEEERECKSKS